MNDLARWLLDQIDEDENEARRAIERTTTSRRMIRGEMVAVKIEPPRWRTAAWPPERVLAECEAKRRIVDLHRPEEFADAPGEFCCGHCQRTAGIYPCQTVRLLFLPYVDRPGYREAWAP